ncbi:MAG: hypothetical protein KAS32_00175 [Candidatus Peribacteraceae bacterium]|nr:hypothetical protein [Candidatus Peribacteraceae bacterium]
MSEKKKKPKTDDKVLIEEWIEGKIQPKKKRVPVSTKLPLLEVAFSNDLNILEACRYASISRQSYYNIIEKWPHLVDKFEQLRITPLMESKMTIAKEAPKAYSTAIDYAKRKSPNEFGDRVINENHNITQEERDKMKDAVDRFRGKK